MLQNCVKKFPKTEFHELLCSAQPVFPIKRLQICSPILSTGTLNLNNQVGLFRKEPMAEESEKYQNKVGLPVKSFEMNLNDAMHKNLTPKIQECLIMFSRYSEYYMIMCIFDGSQTSLSMPR